ncbi:anaerobic ribonucleoside-triphosphate reductase [Candidatus Oleimmundimicrobium sp.]|uniref:anaerobic ribonucleoside-triphosphate reductase n=1 Tax=Candidatus Oleimmundimicrobium sp. TaxID=3060597 RepID=UPI002723D50A|nr:anaerobic ribonucleoside-triphosphate reductase [Candidatus Oleimmundimicrobium sp.]MDO8885401.1 anaerobic ribonucleoside-triphosphate reductase [Candidatus Oleimmundimicrobium sp.]
MSKRVISVIKNLPDRPDDTTDIALLVSTASQQEINGWNKEKIIESLIKETNLASELAKGIADVVEQKILNSNLSEVTTSIIRELIDIELIQRGLTIAHKKHSHLGLPMYDVEQIIFNPNKENSNTTHNPESINLTIAESILKEFALRRVYSEDVALSHLVGDIHIHDLGFIVRPYCGGHSLEYIKKYGLSLPNITSSSKPAKHAEVLIGHMVKMASSLQSHYAGAIGWEAVNMFFAPYMVGRSYDEIKQLAQMLIYEFNQLAGARGSQVVFTDFNLYWNIPAHFRDTKAVGPGGVFTGKTYKEYEKEAQMFLKAMFEIYLEGDAVGKTFVFPKPLLHINKDFFETEGHEEFLDLACKLASKQGITYFVFDRGDEVTVSQCCRLKLRLKGSDLKETKTPEKMRFSALQNVTINLPRIAYKAQDNDQLFFMEIDKAIELVAKAHLQKKEFIKSLLDLGKNGPLAMLSASKDGDPYLKIERLTYLVGLLGLNEMVEAHTGKQLHESDEALKFGLKVISHMNLKCKNLSEQYGINMILEESPAESSGYRLAKLDMKYYPRQTRKVIKGSLENGEYYYTNSVHIAVDAEVDYIERVEKQSLFHPLIEAGAIVHIWLGEHEPDPAAIKSFVVKTFKNTNASQIAFSPEFTVCNNCCKTSRGLLKNCPLCDSDNVYGITRIVGYFSKVSTWNKGKVAEIKDRIRTNLEGGNNDENKTFCESGLPKVSGGQSASRSA